MCGQAEKTVSERDGSGCCGEIFSKELQRIGDTQIVALFAGESQHCQASGFNLSPKLLAEDVSVAVVAAAFWKQPINQQTHAFAGALVIGKAKRLKSEDRPGSRLLPGVRA